MRSVDKQVGINMIANIVSYSSNIIISFVLTPFLINTLGKETYSFYPIANTIVSYMSILSSSLNSMASRFVTISLTKGNELEANKYYSSVMASNFILGTVVLVPMVFIIIFFDSLLEVPINSLAAVRALFALVFSSALINIFSSVFGIATFAKNRIDLRSLRELITAIIRLVLFVVFYKCFQPSIVYVGVVTLIVAIINIAFQYGYTKKLLPELRIRISNISWSHTKDLLGASVWSTINTFGNTLLTGMALILANLFYGSAASGTYSIVQTVPNFINGIIVMLVGVFYPLITYKYALQDKKGLIAEVKKAQSIVGLFTCATIIVFSALASNFFNLWTPGEEAVSLSILSFVTILPHLFIACLWPLTNLNIVMNKVKVPAIFTLSIGVINIIIAYLVYVLSDFGIISLAIISTCLQIVWIGIFIPIYACKKLNINIFTFYPPVIKALFCAIVTGIAVYLVKQFFDLDTWLKFILFGACSGIFGLLVFSFGMIGPKKIVLIFKNLINRRG